jgi:hypothetical protein
VNRGEALKVLERMREESALFEAHYKPGWERMSDTAAKMAKAREEQEAIAEAIRALKGGAA